MSKTYLVWREDEDREDAKKVKAYYTTEAAENWAQWSDSWSADYTIVRGDPARVFVALDEDGSEPEFRTILVLIASAILAAQYRAQHSA